MDLSKVFSSHRLDEIVSESVVGRLGLFIGGIEITQATQYFESDAHLTDPADRQPDNAIRMVASKPAWVRVYVSSLFGASGVTGSLEVQRRSGGFLFNHQATLSPHSSSITSVPTFNSTSYSDTRGSVSGTLNFVIPSDEMIGTLRLIARVTSGSRTAESTIVVAVNLRQTLRLAGVMISYNGPASMAAGAPNLTLAAPTLVDLQAMSGDALTMFPVEATARYRTAGTLALTNHLQDTSFPTSGCGAGWDALHARVANARTADGNRPGWIYYGLLPAAVPMGPVGGCGGGGVAVGPINEPRTLAHEAGHACGLGHAPAGGAPNPDPSYPAYEPYDPANTPQASIGEYGLNVNNGAIASPQTFRDFMSYAAPRWISPYDYGRLLDNERLTPTTVGVDHPWWKDLVWEERLHWPPRIPLPDPPFDLELPVFPPSRFQDVISLIVRIERGKVVGVEHVARTQAHTELPGASQTRFTAHLRDAEGSIIAGASLFRLDTAACGCGGGGIGRGGEPANYLAQAFLSDVGAGAALDISDSADKVVWRREAPAEAPRVLVAQADVDADGNVRVDWRATDGVTEYWLRYSRDGETWQSIATGLTEPGMLVDAGQLPSGDGLLQVVAHDGFYSSYSDPFPVALPERRGNVVILHPVEGHSYAADQEIRLWASLAEPDPASRDAVWLVDGDEVARGLDAWAALKPGEHTVTVRVEGHTGAEASVRVTAVRGEG